MKRDASALVELINSSKMRPIWNSDFTHIGISINFYLGTFENVLVVLFCFYSKECSMCELNCFWWTKRNEPKAMEKENKRGYCWGYWLQCRMFLGITDLKSCVFRGCVGVMKTQAHILSLWAPLLIKLYFKEYKWSLHVQRWQVSSRLIGNLL